MASAIVDGVYEGNIEFVGMFGEVVGAGHAWSEEVSVVDYALYNKSVFGGIIPAAPAPTTKTLFFLCCPSIFWLILNRVCDA